MSIVKVQGMIEIPFSKTNIKKCKSYNYIKNDDTIYFGIRTDKDKTLLYLPREATKFTQIFPEYTLEYSTITQKVLNPVKLTGLKLRDYQQKPFEEIISLWSKGYHDCILAGETSFGKSYCVAAFIAKMQLRTTILVDKTLLATQIFEEIKANSDADVRLLKKGSSLGDVNIVTYQLLLHNKDMLEKLQETTGLLIVDEVHITAASSLIEVVSKFPAKYRLGLSATPTRSDGLTELIYDLFGRQIVIGKNPTAVDVTVHQVDVNDIFYSGATNYKKKLDLFLKSQDKLLVPLIQQLIKKGRKLVIAVDIQKTQEYYKKILANVGIKAEILNAKAKAVNRDAILDKFNNEEIDVIIGFAVLEKGISIPRLDTILHLAGAGTKEKILQLIGRLKREDKRKQKSILIDLQFYGNLEKQQGVRTNTYYDNKVKVKSINSFKRYMELLSK